MEILRWANVCFRAHGIAQPCRHTTSEASQPVKELWSGGTVQLRSFRGNIGYNPFRKWALISLNNAHKPERKGRHGPIHAANAGLIQRAASARKCTLFTIAVSGVHANRLPLGERAFYKRILKSVNLAKKVFRCKTSVFSSLFIHGRQKKGARRSCPAMDFEPWHFSIKVLATKGYIRKQRKTPNILHTTRQCGHNTTSRHPRADCQKQTPRTRVNFAKILPEKTSTLFSSHHSKINTHRSLRFMQSPLSCAVPGHFWSMQTRTTSNDPTTRHLTPIQKRCHFCFWKIGDCEGKTMFSLQAFEVKFFPGPEENEIRLSGNQGRKALVSDRYRLGAVGVKEWSVTANN